MGDTWMPGIASSLTPQRWTSAAVPNTNLTFIYALNGATATGLPMPNVQTVFTSNGDIGPTYANAFPASNASVAVWNGLLYAYGGQLAGGTYTNLPPRRNAAAMVRNNRLYVWGGNTTSSNVSTLADMWQADISTVLAAGSSAAPAPVLRAYPNPSVAGITTLDLPIGTQSLEVFDALGRLVTTATPPVGATRWPLDLHGQSVGIYLVRVRTAQGLGASCRVVRE